MPFKLKNIENRKKKKENMGSKVSVTTILSTQKPIRLKNVYSDKAVVGGGGWSVDLKILLL